MSMLNMLLGASGKATITGTFSGDSIPVLGTATIGLDTSGNQYRFLYTDPTAPLTYAGAWGTVSTFGEFSGSSLSAGIDTENVAYPDGFDVSGSLIRVVKNGGYSSTWVTYTPSSKAFSGSSTAVNVAVVAQGYYYLDTSGGLMSFAFSYQTVSKRNGTYISLT